MCFGLHSLPASLFSKHTSAQYHVADTPNEPDSELERDLRGRKHVNQQDNADALYWMQNDTGSAFVAFNDPGEASVNAFRTFIQGRVPHDLVRDEYGHIKPIAQVSQDHLSTLQAQLWLQKFAEDAHTPSDRMASQMQVDKCGPFVQDMLHSTPQLFDSSAMTDKMLSVASHFTFIVGLLQSKYIFVHHKKSDRTCEIPGCQTRSGTQPVNPTIFTLEPLIHWATVTLAADIILCRGRVQAFRRDGEKCSDPLWTQAIRKYTPQNAPSYCSDCLEMLTDNRVPIMASLDRSVSKSFTAINARPAHLAEAGVWKDTNGWVEKDVNNSGYQTVVRIDELQASRNRTDGHTRVVPLNLDGARDVRPDEDFHNVFGSDSSTTSYDKASASHSDGHSAEGDSTSSATEASPLQDRSFTTESPVSHSDTMPQDDILPPRWSTVNNSPSLLTSPLSNHINLSPYAQATPSFGLDGASNNRAEATLDNKNTIKTSAVNTPSRHPIRAFGREIDLNPVLIPLKMIKDARITKEHTKDIRDFLTPTLNTAQRQGLMPTSTPPIDIPEQDHEPVDIFAAYLAHAAKSDSSPPPKPNPKPKTPPKPKKTSPPRPSPAPPNTGPFPAKLTPLLCPPTISPLTYAAYLSRTPPPGEIICHCRLPARTSAIAQCSNAECAFVWFHYECLDKSAKLSARHGRLVCGVCRNEGRFKEGARTVEEMVRRECKMAFTGREMVAGMEGVGGVVEVERPYGLGVEVVEEESVGAPARGALGELAFFGYAESRPEAVVDAYENAHLYLYVEEEYGYGEEYEEEYEEDIKMDVDEAD